MPNGKIGDHPITDIVVHHRTVFSPAVDALIAEIVRLGGRQELERRFEWFAPAPESFEADLQAMRDRLKVEAKARGWEVSG